MDRSKFILSTTLVQGLPRTGFSLALGLLDRALPSDSQIEKKRGEIDKVLGEKLLNNLQTRIQSKNASDIVFSGEFKSLMGGPKQIDQNGDIWIRKYIGILGAGDAIFSIRLPILFSALLKFFHSHDPFSEKVIQHYVNKESSFTFTKRHPCGVFESSINSLNALSSEYISTTHPLSGIEQERIRHKLALHKITTPHIRESMLAYLESKMAAQARMEEHIKTNLSDVKTLTIQWEEIISDEAECFTEIDNFCKHLTDAKRPSSKIIFQDMKFKNDLQFHLHNFRPGHASVINWQNALPLELALRLEEKALKSGYVSKKVLDFYERKLPPLKHEISDFSLKKNEIGAFEKLNLAYTPIDIPNDLLCFSLNKTNVDQSYFSKDFIIDKRYGNNLKVERMSHEVETYLDDAFEHLSCNLYQIEQIAESAHSAIQDILIKRELGESIRYAVDSLYTRALA